MVDTERIDEGPRAGARPFVGMSSGRIPRSADVVVIGAGIAGAAAAYELARRGMRVVVFDKGVVAGEQSGRNLGFVRQQGRDVAELPLVVASRKLWETLEQRLGGSAHWAQAGNLALAPDEKTALRYRQWAHTAREFGVETTVLTGRQAAERVPGLRGSWEAGIFTPSDGQAEPRAATRLVASAAVREGAEFVLGRAVEEIVVAGGQVQGVRVAGELVGSRIVVCAAGIWSSLLLSDLGIRVPQRLMRPTVVRTWPVPAITRAGLLTGKGISLRQDHEGGIVAYYGKADVDLTKDSVRDIRRFLPMYWANRSKFALRVNRESVRSLRSRIPRFPVVEPAVNSRYVQGALAHLADLFPALAPFAVERAWAGVIEGTPDGLPVLDAPRSPSGLVIATCQTGHGFALGPIFGTIVADLVTVGSATVDIRSLRASRFEENDYGGPRNVI